MRKRWPKNDPLLDEMLATDGSRFFRIKGHQVEDVLAGGYYLIDYRGYQGYRPGENVGHVFCMGALAPEAAEASDRLLERGIYANVIIVTSPSLLLGLQGRENQYEHLRQRLKIDGSLHLSPDGQVIEEPEVIDLAGRRTPIVSIHDGEEGLLDNIGSLVGARQISLCVRRFSKCGTPAQIFEYHGMDASDLVEACGRALAESALEKVRLTPAAFAVLRNQQGQDTAVPWKELWPDPV